MTLHHSGTSKSLMRLLFCKAGLILMSAACALALGACSTPTSGGNKGQSLREIPSRIQKGVTTQDSVRAALGEPEGRELSPAGERWLYGSAANQKSTAGAVGSQVLSTGIGMIPYAGGAINGLRSIARVSQSSRPGATIDFDQRGIVRDYTVAVH